MSTLTQEAVRRNSSRSNADEVEPILISEWPLSRGEIARVSIRSFKGTWLIDLRKWFETGDGELRAGLRLLIVFRSDYQSLIFKFDLPPLVAANNWIELSAYDRNEAEAFLRSGGRELAPETADRLFRGLDRIEDAPGMYRLITLNMVGLVLERMGRKLEGDPGRLIQSYLGVCLSHGETRDFARFLLAHMITDLGTKEPRAEDDLAEDTGFASWQVKATLAELARQGLVRKLEVAEATWEIAHDFLARAIGQFIGRLRPTLWRRTRPWLAPLLLLGWIVSVFVAWPYWATVQVNAAETALRKLGATLAAAKPDGISVSFGGISNETLAKAQPYLEKIDPTDFSFFNRDQNITSLEALRDLTNLNALAISGAASIGSLDPLKGLTNLRNLTLYEARGITTLEPLKELTNLNNLTLTAVGGITSLEPLKGLTNLNSLTLIGARGITNLEPLKELTNLRDLTVTRATGVTSLEPLKGLTNLSYLDLTGAAGITTVEPLKGLTNLRSLNLVGATGITTLEPLKGKRGQITFIAADGNLRETME
jgi:hypothetical protein